MSDENINYSGNDVHAISYLIERKVELKKQNQKLIHQNLSNRSYFVDK